MFDLTVDDNGLLAALLQAGSAIEAEMETVMETSMEELAVEARKKKHHRFITKGGFAEKSILSRTRRSGFIGQVYLETGIAHYSPYLHQGFRSWKPDEFLFSALEEKQSEIVGDVVGAINKGLRKVKL